MFYNQCSRIKTHVYNRTDFRTGLKGEKTGHEFARCDESESWISFPETNLNLEIRNQSVSLHALSVPEPEVVSLDGKLLCSGKIRNQIFGVWSSQGQLSTAVRHDQSWTFIKPEMTVADREMAACVAYEDKIYVCGGWSDRQGILASCEYFDGIYYSDS